jgi:N-acetylneuraminate synthase
MIKDNILFIAEIGINHNGDLNLAKKLIETAKNCNFDIVKFQKRNIDKVYSKEFLNDLRVSPWGKTQRDQKKHLEFEKNEYDEINKFCQRVGIDWFASAWDIDSLNFLDQYNLKYNNFINFKLISQKVIS